MFWAVIIYTDPDLKPDPVTDPSNKQKKIRKPWFLLPTV